MNDLTRYAEPVLLALRGEPNPHLSTPGKELRYGSRGSLAVDLEKATVYDHEAAEGWGLLDFIRLETGEHNPLAWMEAQGIKEPANDHQAPPKVRRQLVATYDYRDAAGELVYQVVRYEPKDFRQRRPDPGQPSGWSWSIKGVTPLPYRLPELVAKPDAPVFVVEGEKDADNLAALGFLATCNSGGAKKWPDSLGDYFRGRRVVILPDNDQAGHDHANAIAAKLHRAGAAGVKVLELPNLPPKGDVSDWLAAGGTREALRELAAAAPVWEPGTLPAPANDNAAPDDVHNLPPILSWPHMSEKGRPLNTIPNLAHLLNHYGFTVRYDVIRKDLVIRYPGQSGTVDNQRQAAPNTVLSLCGLNSMPKTEAPAYLLSIGDQAPINPVMDWITSKPWDGRSRLADLADTLTTAPDYSRELLALLLRRWLVSAVAAAAMPSGFRSKGVLTLQGPQSIGKTAWFMSLVPEEQRDLLKVDAIIDTRDKDTITSAVSHWLVELGELDGTFRKSDIARLKGFISADFDQFRRLLLVFS